MKSIEMSGPSPATPKASAAAESSGSKSKVKSNDGSEGSAGAGFLALLTSLAPPAVAPEPLPTAVATVADVPEADQSDNLAMLMAQAGQVATSLPAAEDPAPALPTIVAQSTLKQAASSTANDKSDMAVDLFQGSETGLMVKADEAVSAPLDRIKHAMAARAIQNFGIGQLQSAAAATTAEPRSPNVTSVLHDLASTPTLASAVAASGWNEGLTRPSERTGSKSAGLQSAFGVDGGAGANLFQAGSRGDLPSVMVNPSMPSFGSAVAEKLNYWIAQGVQNAELELEGLGDEPVSVRISLKGDEAHIGFRTDQPEIRRLLEGASTQLKELLANEGLLLSQVSVGTSGQDRSNQQDGRPPTAIRARAIESAQAPASQVARQPGTSIGTAVDLFV
jgi:flagellar hook-length control protein FliK